MPTLFFPPKIYSVNSLVMALYYKGNSAQEPQTIIYRIYLPKT